MGYSTYQKGTGTFVVVLADVVALSLLCLDL